MLLRRIEIQSFRGVRAIDLALDDTTLLIGENASGKTSVLAAVQAVLAPETDDPFAPLAPADIHRAFSRDDDAPGDLRIALTFVQGDESPWPDEARSRLGPAIREAADGRPLLCLELTATPAGDALDHRWRFRDPVSGDAIDAAPDQVETVRRCAPVAMLDPGSLAPREGARTEPADEFGAIYRRITHQRTQLEPAELREAAELAGGVAARMLERIGRADTPARRWLADIAALRDLVAAGDDRRLADLLLGAGSRMLSLLALAGAALRSDGDGDRATPLLCVDTPEARLHPLSLAPLWDLLQLLPGQKIVTTNSGDLLASAPLDAIRRLVRADRGVRVGAVQPGSLDDEGRRRVSYHVRTRRGGAFFARSWLLVEGETEFWLLPELARTLGYDFAVEGVAVVEFAQCGVPPLIHVARDLGIAWCMLTDNDRSGRGYVDAARRAIGHDRDAERIVVLDNGDIEEALWDAGFAEVYRAAAYGGSTQARTSEKARTVIELAIKAVSKPHLALRVIEEASKPNAPAPPDALVRLIEMAVNLARGDEPTPPGGE
jgi:putative ATP-dependent endonuclease of OLD family